MSCLIGGKRFTHKKQTDTNTCFSNDSLIRIANALNASSTFTHKIPSAILSGLRKNSKKARTQMVRIMRKAFESKCPANNLPQHVDSCIIQKFGDKIALNKDEVAPPAPTNELLDEKPWSTSEVTLAMKYIEKKYPHFVFLEAAPMDFDSRNTVGQCVISELCTFNIDSILRKKKRSFGIIFNTHPSYKPGGHWICLYVCLVTGRVCFYDSYGFLPEKEVVRLMKRIQSQYQERFHRPMKLLYNNVQNQDGGVECGTYCIMFLSEMARHGNMSLAVKYVKDDKRVKELRHDILTYSVE